MRRLFLFSALIFLASITVKGQDLIILHTNDTHSQIETYRTTRNKGLAGVERRLQFIDSQIEQYGKENVLILDAGDYSQGTPYFVVGKGDLEVDLMNIIGYDVAALGNHEFDNGQAELARRLKNANYKTVCANYDFEGTPLEKNVKPYVIIKKAGLKIGIIGATTDLAHNVSASAIKGIEHLNTTEIVNNYAALLKNKKGCDLVILLSHLGYSEDEQVDNLNFPSDTFLAKNSRNIDIIVGGHSHTFLKQVVPVQNLDGKNVLISQTGAGGVYVGKFVLKSK